MDPNIIQQVKERFTFRKYGAKLLTFVTQKKFMEIVSSEMEFQIANSQLDIIVDSFAKDGYFLNKYTVVDFIRKTKQTDQVKERMLEVFKKSPLRMLRPITSPERFMQIVRERKE